MQKFLTLPSRLFLILASLFGLIWVFLMPTGAGYDEETHLARIFEISRGYFIPNQWLLKSGNGIPASMLRVSYRQQQFLQPITREDIEEGLHLGITGDDWITHKTRATYSPFLYLPQAVLLAVFGYLLKTPILVLYWILRLTYLAIYIAAAFFAIQLMPKFKWTLFVLALAPMAMIQAVSISADPMTNGMSFLIVAWSLSLVEGKKPITKKTFWITILLAFLLFSVKPNSAPLILLLVLLKRDQFSSRKQMIGFWSLLAILFLVEVGGWSWIQSQAEATRRGLEAGQTNSFLTLILANPVKFALDLANYVIGNLPTVLREYVASFGYGYYAMPIAVYVIFLISLAAAILNDWQVEGLSRGIRIALLVEFVVLFFGTFALRLAIKQSIGSLALSQGRYFIPFLPLLVFSIFGGQLSLGSKIKRLEIIPAAGSFVMLMLVTAAMYLVYYVPCGMYVFSPGQCVIPVYKNWQPARENSLLVSFESTLEQTFQPDCVKIDDLRFYTFTNDEKDLKGKFALTLSNLKSEKTAVQDEYPIALIQNGGMTILEFPTIKVDTNAKYSIQLKLLDSADPFSIGLSDMHRIRGELTQSGQPVDKDLLFQYRCSQ